MYIASIALLFATFGDGTITVQEALSFLVLYGVYLFILFRMLEAVSKPAFQMSSS